MTPSHLAQSSALHSILVFVQRTMWLNCETLIAEHYNYKICCKICYGTDWYVESIAKPYNKGCWQRRILPTIRRCNLQNQLRQLKKAHRICKPSTLYAYPYPWYELHYSKFQPSERKCQIQANLLSMWRCTFSISISRTWNVVTTKRRAMLLMCVKERSQLANSRGLVGNPIESHMPSE